MNCCGCLYGYYEDDVLVCRYDGNDYDAPCSEVEEPSRYTVVYDGYLFEGDKETNNRHDTDDWDWVCSLIDAYGDVIVVEDNYYGVTFAKGEWY